MAKELTTSYSTLGSAGISAIIRSSPFPAMGETYKSNPLSEEEVFALTAYLKSVSDNSTYQRPSDFGITFIVLGAVVFILILISIIVIYFNRRKEAVNHKIHNRQSPVTN